MDQLNQWITRPIDDSAFFVRTLYLDVLKREPDSGGLAFCTNALDFVVREEFTHPTYSISVR